MEYARLGNTGLKVSRICLGCMSYGDPERASPDGSKRWPWALSEDESRPFFKRALELGINFFDTANVYSAGSSEEITGRALKEFARREDVVLATKVHRGDERGTERSGALAQGHFPRSSTRACAGWGRTTSISTRSTAGTTGRPSWRRWKRCTTSCAPARSAISARRRCTPGSSARRSTSPSGADGRPSSRCRTTTTCSTARRSAR